MPENRKKLFIVLGFFIMLFIAVIVYVAFFSKKPPIETKPVLPTPVKTYSGSFGASYPFDPKPFEQGENIGDVIVTKDDLDYKYKLNFPDTEEARSSTENWQKIADMVTDDAILVNEGIKDGIYDEPVTGLNPAVINKARDYYETEGTTYISGEAIMVWFHNVDVPEIGTAAAKIRAKSVIDGLRNEIINGRINIFQAGERIRQMPELEEIDKSYKVNSYFDFEYHKIFNDKFTDPVIDEELWKLEKGELSEVIIGHDYGVDSWYDAYYILIKINDKYMAEFDSVDELLAARKAEGLKVNLMN